MTLEKLRAAVEALEVLKYDGGLTEEGQARLVLLLLQVRELVNHVKGT